MFPPHLTPLTEARPCQSFWRLRVQLLSGFGIGHSPLFHCDACTRCHLERVTASTAHAAFSSASSGLMKSPVANLGSLSDVERMPAGNSTHIPTNSLRPHRRPSDNYSLQSQPFCACGMRRGDCSTLSAPVRWLHGKQIRFGRLDTDAGSLRPSCLARFRAFGVFKEARHDACRAPE